MDIRQLSYFVAVYEQGSISGAARQCCVAQPSLSAALRQLELELGVKLFIRLSKGVTPTEDGDKLYGHAGKLLSQLKSLKASFHAPVNRVQFRLGLIKALGVERMSALLREFSQQVEGLELHLVEPDQPCDARIITPQQLKTGEVLQPIWQDRYLLALPPAWPLSLQLQIALEDFAGLPLIKRLPCDAWAAFYPELVQRDIQPDIRADIQTIEYALGLVSAGVGCALVPDLDSLRQRTDVSLRPIHGLQLERTLVLAHSRNQDSAALQVLRQLCQQAAARH
ncbi:MULTISPECIES: LysR family transcriptional regulator [unclassified Arsukibacterium]|uniref:LysR family transcriptional regulator n=1 Tax=unclassified Arsukibacterium TaxID=2635278 RepID=UPI000C5EE6E3|nr:MULTISPECIES: LysR family transcriptional regulator [unclassified Arsukibacterium]MAA96230.1 LysR family transcriptional regulator [Rheinheimera sp.]MBM34882.1 LysR family transcriptional regulator [Rheinheimera sp.]HAW94600.1 LysR family transcriptional regulator [Candidatus Azambacteria bacterium]|tara:strand:+ start:34282 stop:35124 length:843 start_codon:yes stop_codon:yes gene_type:complete